MTLYVQYDDVGNITATVRSQGIPAPECDNQLALEEGTDLLNKKIDIVNKVLINL